MSKTRAHKRSTATRNGQRVALAQGKMKTSGNETASRGAMESRGVEPGRAALYKPTPYKPAPGIQTVIMPGMVALGCWGMAFTFIAFSTDTNRFIFGGMAALMALMWSISFSIRLRKVLRQK